MGDKYDIQPSCFTLTIPDNISGWTGDTITHTISPVNWGDYINVSTHDFSDYTITCTGSSEIYNSVCQEDEGILRTNRKRVELKFL